MEVLATIKMISRLESDFEPVSCSLSGGKEGVDVGELVSMSATLISVTCDKSGSFDDTSMDTKLDFRDGCENV